MEPILVEGLKTVLIVGTPITIIVALASLLITAVQSSMTVAEPALGHVARLLVFLAGCYLFLPSAIDALTKLAETAWR